MPVSKVVGFSSTNKEHAHQPVEDLKLDMALDAVPEKSSLVKKEKVADTDSAACSYTCSDCDWSCDSTYKMGPPSDLSDEDKRDYIIVQNSSTGKFTLNGTSISADALEAVVRDVVHSGSHSYMQLHETQDHHGQPVELNVRYIYNAVIFQALKEQGKLSSFDKICSSVVSQGVPERDPRLLSTKARSMAESGVKSFVGFIQSATSSKADKPRARTDAHTADKTQGILPDSSSLSWMRNK